MKATNQHLSDRELNYTKRRFKKYQIMVNWLWIVYLIIILLGIPFVLVDDILGIRLFGGGLVLVGLLGAYYYKKNSAQTKFKILPKQQTHQGILSQRLVGLTNKKQYCLFVDDYLLETPDGLERYLWDLVDKYSFQKVNITVAVAHHEKGGKIQKYYTPLKIENDICIDNAIKKHGVHFLRKATHQLYFDITMLILLFCLNILLIYGLLSAFDLEGVTLLLFILIPLGMIGFDRLYRKLVPRKNIDLQEKVKCP